jgi:transcriptional regulator with XRE-family HTH domain
VTKRLVRALPTDARVRTISALVGRRLRARRTHLGLAIVNVAKALGIAPSVYKGYEAGTEQAPALLLADIAELYGRPVLWFFQDVAALEEENRQIGGCCNSPRVYRVATVEQRVHFLIKSFQTLDLEGQQHLIAIAAALSLSDQELSGRGSKCQPVADRVWVKEPASTGLQRNSSLQNSSRKSK